jgi:7,8-dihydropterin-6-yl-methyl-4-(beta-D-ribofuranosyl)aminobenzene 5'-phosphate synthase
MSSNLTLLPVDVVGVTILVDNSVDVLLPGTEMVQRAPLAWDWSEREQLIAEHGYALLTDFEKGFPLQQVHTHDGWEPDTWIWDDQAVVCHLKDKGLVVLSSCSHAGVINVLRHAQRLTGIEQVYAFVGGLHLTGGIFEPIIPRTITELKSIGPSVIVPGHCTGWKATHELARQLPDAYIQTSVGTQLHFA